MKVSNEISLENFQAINSHAAGGVGRKVRSIQNDRWLRSTGPRSYQSLYDPAIGRLATSWIELRPGLIVMYGEARPRSPIAFPIRASSPLAGVFIGSRISTHRAGSDFGERLIERGGLPGPEPRVVPISLAQDEQCQFHLAGGVPAYFFGILGRDEALGREFSIMRRIACFDGGKAERPSNRQFAPKVKGEVCSAILQMLRNRFQGDIRDAFVCGKALEVLSLILHSAEGPASEARSEQKKRPVEFVCNEIARMPAEDLVLSDFATYLEVSERTLSRQFKVETGMTFSAFQRKKRMELAAQLLASGTGSTTSVARQVGYESVTAFFRAFREELDMTPDEYRRVQLH